MRISYKSFLHNDFLQWPSRSPKESLKSSLKITQELNNGPIQVATSVFQALPLRV